MKVPTDNNKYAERFFYDLTFFILIVIIWLNLIFGIIIDTFGTLREEKNLRGYLFTNKF